jgi:MFS family permease
MSFGMTAGMMSPGIGALWAEIYGTVHIGAIRALVTSAFVFASAIGPGISGALIDMQIELNAQSYLYAAYSLTGTSIYFFLRPKFKARVEAMAEQRAAANAQ